MSSLRASLREHRPLLLAVGVMVACYAPWLNAGYVNLEYPFHLAARALAGDPSPGLMDAYFDKQANPLGYSILLSLIYRAVGISSAPWIARLPSLAGAVLLLVAAWIWYRRDGSTGRASFGWWSALIISHPMIAAFATHGTADLLPSALIVSAIVIATLGSLSPYVRISASAMLLALASVTKYSVAFLALGVVAAWPSALRAVPSPRARCVMSGLGLVIPATIVGAHLVWMEQRFGVWLSTCVERCAPDPRDIDGFLGNLGGYITFLGLFLGLVPIAEGRQSRLAILRSSVIGTVALVLFLTIPTDGEMDFGALIGTWRPVAFVLLLAGAVIAGHGIVAVRWWAAPGQRRRLLLSAVVPAILIFAISRPTQRYLIPVVPLLFLALISGRQSRGAAFLRLATVGTFVPVSILGLTYLRAQGDASEATAQWLRGRDLIASSSPGAICPHACHHWVGISAVTATLEVAAFGSPEAVPASALHVEEMRVFGKLVRTYAVVPVESESE